MNENQTPPKVPAGAQTDNAAVNFSPTVRPTKKQKELLEFIEKFIVQHGYSPSYREIMSGLDYTSVATVALHVKNLINRGQLRKRDHSARSLEVVAPELANPPKLATNQLKEAEERWLIDKIEQRFAIVGSEAAEPRQIAEIEVLLAALRVLGLDGAAQSFTDRLRKLKSSSSD